MHNDDSPIERSTAEEDELTETAVLMSVFDVHPAQLTVAELAREMTVDPQSFSSEDRVNRAVQRLVGAGLLRRHGDSIIVTRAAHYLWSLVS